MLQLNCTSAKTFPPTSLKWLLNGREVSPAHVLEHPKRKGAKSGLFRTRIGLDVPLRQTLFRKGIIRAECIGEVKYKFPETVILYAASKNRKKHFQVEDGVIQGWNEGSNSHLIQTVRLPEALKREVTQVFVGKSHAYLFLFIFACERVQYIPISTLL